MKNTIKTVCYLSLLLQSLAGNACWLVMQTEEEEHLIEQSHTTVIHNRQDKETPIMKKYTKLVLMVVAIISSLCFLIYKYRYDRLYNVLQVLEVFGTPDDPSFVPCKTPPALELTPAWQRVSPTVYLYSAYCDYTIMDMVEGTCPTVTAIGVAMGEPKDYKCKLW